MNNLSTTVKMLRKQYNLTQEELSLKSGVGLRFVRDLEQGKETPVSYTHLDVYKRQSMDNANDKSLAL